MAYNGCTGHPSLAEYLSPGEPCYIDAIEVGSIPPVCRSEISSLVFSFFFFCWCSGQLGWRNAIAAERMIASLLR